MKSKCLIGPVSKYSIMFFLIIFVFALVGCAGKETGKGIKVSIASADDAICYFSGTWRISNAVNTEGEVVLRYAEEFVHFRKDRYILDYDFGRIVKKGTLIYNTDGSILMQDDNDVAWNITIIDMNTFTERTNTGDYSGILYTLTRLPDAGIISKKK